MKQEAVEKYTARKTSYLTLTGYGCCVLLGLNAVLVPSLILPVERAFNQTDAGIGVFYFIGALLYGTGTFSGGILTERVGRHMILPLAVLLLGAGLVGQALAPLWIVFIIAALFLNYGAGAIDGGLNALFLAIYSEGRGGALNLLHLFFSIGALIGPFLVGQLVGSGVAWQVIMLAYGVIGIVLAGLLAGQQMPSGRRTVAESAHATEQVSAAERSLLPFACLAVSIGCYVASEMGVSNWLVKFLDSVPESTATTGLSLFWAGLALGRFLANWLADRINPYAFTAGCILLASVTLVAAAIVPVLPLVFLLYALAGLFLGPIYPMLMVIGGAFYPHRLAVLTGSLATAAVVGSLVYPPLMGLMAENLGIRTGMIGTGLLQIVAALALFGAMLYAWRSKTAQKEAPSR